MLIILVWGGKTVVVPTLDYEYGYFDWISNETDETGRAAFIYNAPDDITPLVGTSINFNLSYTETGVIIDSLPVTIEFVQP